MQPTPPIRSDRPGTSLLGDLLGSHRSAGAEVADLARLMGPETGDLVLRELPDLPAGVVEERGGVSGDAAGDAAGESPDGSAPGLPGE